MRKIVNTRNARFMLQRYEKFLKMEKTSGNFNIALEKETGYYEDDILCKEVSSRLKPVLDTELKTKSGECICKYCIWDLTEEVFNLPGGCGNGNGEELYYTTDWEEGKKLLRERAEMLKALLDKVDAVRAEEEHNQREAYIKEQNEKVNQQTN